MIEYLQMLNLSSPKQKTKPKETPIFAQRKLCQMENNSVKWIRPSHLFVCEVEYFWDRIQKQFITKSHKYF
jgi:hypothetical protein